MQKGECRVKAGMLKGEGEEKVGKWGEMGKRGNGETESKIRSMSKRKKSTTDEHRTQRGLRQKDGDRKMFSTEGQEIFTEGNGDNGDGSAQLFFCCVTSHPAKSSR